MTDTKTCTSCQVTKSVGQFAKYPSQQRRPRCRTCVTNCKAENAALPCTIDGCTYTCGTESAVKNHLSRKHGIRSSTRGSNQRLTPAEQLRITQMRSQVCRGGNMDTSRTIAIFGSMNMSDIGI